MKKCPFCLAEIDDEATKCRHCGEWVVAPPLTVRPLDPPSEAPIRMEPAAAPPPAKVCRMCGAAFAPRAVLCLECGYDTRTRRIRPGAGKPRRTRRRAVTSIMAGKSLTAGLVAVAFSLLAAAVTLAKGAAWPNLVVVLCAFAGLATLAALVLAAVGLFEVWRSEGQIRGIGPAVAGLVLTFVSCSGLLVPGTLYLAHARASKMGQHALNLKQIALAIHNYHDTHDTLPPPAILSPDGKPLLSWRVAILPYVDQNPLYNRFKLDEPWDSPHNVELMKSMPALYRLPGVSHDPTVSHYQVIVGKGTVFEGPKGLSLSSITDGSSNTILVAEAAQPVPWTKPDDLAYDPGQPLPAFGDHYGGIALALCDGSVRFLRKDVDEPTLRALITRDGGEVLGNLPDLPIPPPPEENRRR
jgi:ribosomal protein L40E